MATDDDDAKEKTTIYIDKQIKAELDVIAKKERLSRSDVMRRAYLREIKVWKENRRNA